MDRWAVRENQPDAGARKRVTEDALRKEKTTFL
jgi:hypothetical protein